MTKVAMLTGSMSRQAGGLLNSISALSHHLRACGTEVEVFAGEDRYSAADHAVWRDTPVHVLPVAGPRAFGFQPGLASSIARAAPDLVHLHGVWMYPSLAGLRWSRKNGPRVISPRGMLDAWAINNSRWKKRVVGALFEDTNLRGAACIHALCASERDAIRALGLKVPVAVIPNGVDSSIADGPFSPPPWADRVPQGARVLLFLGRIHPKKGLSGLLEGFARARSLSDWHLVIAGWDEGGHESELRARLENLDVKHKVHFVGPQFGSDKAATLAAADAFVLPSLSEGLPMAVLEAWAFGLPVLMTPNCNLPEGFEAGAAIRTEPNAASIADALIQLTQLTQSERDALGNRGRALVEGRFSWSEIAREMRDVYEWTLGGGPVPASIASDQLRHAWSSSA